MEAGGVLDLLAQLVNKSIVVAEREGGEEARYRLLETIREFGREKLNEAGDLDLLRSAHAPAHWVRMVEEVSELQGEEQSQMFGDSLPIGLRLIRSEDASTADSQEPSPLQRENIQ